VTKRQWIGRKTGEKVYATLYLQKDEKKFVEGLASKFRGVGSRRSGFAQAIEACIRLAGRCILEHATETETPGPLTVEQLASLGVDVKKDFQIEVPKPVQRREARAWKRNNPPEPVTKIR
jgi:hypothetical protein